MTIVGFAQDPGAVEIALTPPSSPPSSVAEPLVAAPLAAPLVAEPLVAPVPTSGAVPESPMAPPLGVPLVGELEELLLPHAAKQAPTAKTPTL